MWSLVGWWRFLGSCWRRDFGEGGGGLEGGFEERGLDLGELKKRSAMF